jgi:hypothetical protein
MSTRRAHSWPNTTCISTPTAMACCCVIPWMRVLSTEMLNPSGLIVIEFSCSTQPLLYTHQATWTNRGQLSANIPDNCASIGSPLVSVSTTRIRSIPLTLDRWLAGMKKGGIGMKKWIVVGLNKCVYIFYTKHHTKLLYKLLKVS